VTEASRPATSWARWGLLQRIAVVQGALLLSAAALAIGLLTYQHRGETIADQKGKARLLLLVVSPLVAEQAVVGDYASIKQLLERQANVYSNISSLLWARSGVEEVAVKRNPAATAAPAWFERLVNFPVIRHSIPISLGGMDYGTLDVALDQTLAVNELWQEFAYYALVSSGAAVTLLLALLLVLRGNLLVLRNLASAADKFSQGEYEVRINTEGAREVHDAAAAFNNMADRIQQLLANLSESQFMVREQLHFTEELIEALPVPMFCKNTKGVYTSVNKAWEAFFGVSRREMIGRKVRDLYSHHPEMGDFHEKMDQELWRDGGVQVYEVPILAMAGRERQAMYCKTTLTDADGHVSGMIGILTDLTELKGAVQKAREALVDKTVAERRPARPRACSWPT
jgi:PAS domain S-box-containing protein